MVDYNKEYERWSGNESLDVELQQQLVQMNGDKQAIKDCFHRSLSFGTAGIRGIMGVGPNRMNIYTIRKVAQGLAQYMKKRGMEQKGVVIAYDSRHKSFLFAKEAGLVFAQHGINVYVFDDIRPTPELSFAVRHLQTCLGMMITASHNPAMYNGLKVYGSDGAQITSILADWMIDEIADVTDELAVQTADLGEAHNQGLFHWVGEQIDQAYQEKLRTLVMQPALNNKEYHVVYTPLHGTGNQPVRKILHSIGFQYVSVVSEQEHPDPNFSTVYSPNPEEHRALELALKLADEKGADMVLATDPDADRVGVAVRDANGIFQVLTGNQIGALLLDYRLSQYKQKGMLPSDGAVIKTIVTSEMGRAVADRYGVETWDTLTGFKYIAEKIGQWENDQTKTFLFGYEESDGYLIGDFCRDKDAVQASMLIAEMGAYYQHQGFTLYEKLYQLYKQIGYFQEDLISITFSNQQGKQEMEQLIQQLRENPLYEVADIPVVQIKDYLQNADGLPQANVIKYFLQDDSWFAIRLSGTEPKLKIYFGVNSHSFPLSLQKLENIKTDIIAMISKISCG